MSKYIGMKFRGWRVVSFTNAPSRHKIFKLEKRSLFSRKTVELRDNTLTRLGRGELDIRNIVR